MKDSIKILKMAVVIMMSLSVSLDAFALVERTGRTVVKNIEMETLVMNAPASEGINLNEAEYPYFEDRSIKISNKDLGKVLQSAFNSK